MRKDESLTLANIRKSPKLNQPEKVVRLSDLLTKEERREFRQAKRTSQRKRRPYNAVDAYVAEMIARFGYEVYEKWKREEIPAERMLKFMLAERARDRQKIYNLEALIVSAMAGANHGNKHGKPPKSLKLAYKILNEEQKLAEGRGK